MFQQMPAARTQGEGGGKKEDGEKEEAASVAGQVKAVVKAYKEAIFEAKAKKASR